jgi:predicted TIM-barrel fold metal-dependent hydrolase
MATAEDLKRDWQHDVAEITLLPEPEPAEIWCPIISVDDHVLEPFTLFEDFGASGAADVLPRVETDDTGRPHWLIGEERHAIVMANACVGRPHSEWAAFTPQRYEDFRRGTWDIPARIRDMDLIGLWASLCFPSMPWGFCGTAFLRMPDRRAGLEALRAYNRWMLDGWCAEAPDRFIPCQLPWLADPAVAAEEVRANARLGFRAVSFTENPEPLGLPSIYSSHWDPFLAACEETGTVLNLHVGSSGTVQRPSTETPSPAILALFPLNSLMAVVDWVFAKVPVRFPELRIVLSEGGANWVPMLVERLQRSRRVLDTPGSNWSASDPDPVELLRRSFWFASLEDPLAFRLLDVVGEDRLMVESDYPHGDSTWPGTQALLRSETEGVLTGAALRKVCFANAAALYDHPEPPASMLAASAAHALA